MLRVLLDLLWWTADRAWGWVRTLSGDDAYERYLASARVEPLSRRAFFEQRVSQHWDRYDACGRCFGADDPTPPES